jgi:hypothetical protein
MLANADVRAPPKRASGGLRFPLTKTYMDVGKTLSRNGFVGNQLQSPPHRLLARNAQE